MTGRPVSIVTGFLGSGKTTLLQRVLRSPGMANTAVLVNEFGEVGLDHHLLRRIDERTVLLGGGCVCCSTRQDLVEGLLDLLGLEERGEIGRLERVVVETTGLADPAPILHTVFSDPVLQHRFFVDVVVTTVDAVNGHLHLDRNPESVRQVTAADKLVVTKTDIAGPEARSSLLTRLRALNPTAEILEAVYGGVEPAVLFGGGGARAPSVGALPAAGPHDTGETFSVSVVFDGPVDWTAFGIWLSMLLHARGEDVLRVKGLLDTGGPGPVVLNGVQHIVHPPQHLSRWPDEDRRSRVVFIMRRIPPGQLLRSLEAFRGLLGAGPRQVEGARSGAAS